MRVRLSFAVVASLFVASSLLAQPVRNGDVSNIRIFPPSNWWNTDITNAPADSALTTKYITNFIGANVGLHPDFGGDVDPLDDPTLTEIYGMPYIVVSSTQPRVQVTFTESPSESDFGQLGLPAGYPIPDEAKFGKKWKEGGYPGNVDTGEDQHMLIIDKDLRVLYELYHTTWNAAQNRWEAFSGAVFSLDSNRRRPDTWTSADAAGLAIFPGLVRYAETMSGQPIRHAFRLTVHDSNGYVYPGSHNAGSNTNAPPMGTRLRLKPGKVITGYLPYIQRIFQAMKTYGLIVADNGSDMYIGGQYDTNWLNDELNPAFSSLKASDFEVIQAGWKPSTTIPNTALSFYTLTPCRILDTRQANGPLGGPSLHGSGEQRVVIAVGTCGIPASAKAISVNITVAAPPASGNLRAFPGDGLVTTTAVMTFVAPKTRGNNAVLPLAANGDGSFALANYSGLSEQVIVDVNGYFQ